MGFFPDLDQERAVVTPRNVSEPFQFRPSMFRGPIIGAPHRRITVEGCDQTRGPSQEGTRIFEERFRADEDGWDGVIRQFAITLQPDNAHVGKFFLERADYGVDSRNASAQADAAA